MPVCLILFSAGFVHLIAPQSIGTYVVDDFSVIKYRIYKGCSVTDIFGPLKKKIYCRNFVFEYIDGIIMLKTYVNYTM